ncbi:hypothetical protein BU23DRAFT_433966, partial [Bimuria novae-zelandiae CBS 107.79]
RIFHFPTSHGPRLAVAVETTDASMLLSFYSILVNSAVGQLWAIIIIMGVYATLRQPAEARSHNAVVASVGVLNAKRPLDVGALIVNYLYKLGRKSPWSLTIWLSVSIFALIASVGVPALVGRSMVLGHGAPVDPAHIYVPGILDNSVELALRSHVLEVPSVLRAVGSVQLANDALYKDNVQIDEPLRVADRPDIGEGEYTSRYRYRYQVPARDFGLQRFDGLVFHVEGSCVTEYGWFNSTFFREVDAKYTYPVDDYYLWNDGGRKAQSSTWGAPTSPIGYFKINSASIIDDGSHSNISFAIQISSVGRISNTPGKDPFYLTEEQQQDDGLKYYIVQSARPILSCWESDSWAYEGRNFSITKLENGDHSIDGFPKALGKIFYHFLLAPKIATIGVRLSASALLSATVALGENFDAGSANVHSDLVRLVLTSYIATKNTLADTTLFTAEDPSSANVPNLLEESELGDVSNFIIYSRDVSALSLAVLITVPIVVIVM